MPPEASETPIVGRGAWRALRGLALRGLQHPRVGWLFAVATLVVVPTYLVWRLTSTLNPDWPAASALMLLADAMFGLSAMGFALARLRGDGDTPAAPAPRQGLSVDVWIPTYNEDVELLRRTVQHALKMDYPHTTYVLDDGARDEVRALCAQLGARYLSRTDRAHGKAGNLNHALGQTKSALIATFDADFVPQPDFLTRLLGHFDDPSVALVQTPQRYYNVDSFQHHKGARAIWDEQQTFFDVTLAGLAAWQSAYWVGTNAVLRTEAVQAIGGFPTISLIEDMLTGMSFHAKGYKSVYVKEDLAHGMAPAFASQFLTQRLRWAQGAFQILRRQNPLFKRGLSPMQRLLYFTSLFHFAEGVPRAIFYALPALYISFGVAPLMPTAGVALGIGAYLLFNIMAALCMTGGRARLLRSELFGMIRFLPYLRGALAFVGKPPRFVVTGKGGSQDQNATSAWHLVGPVAVLALNLGAAVVGLSLLRYLALDSLNAGTLALTACVGFSLFYAAMAAWAVRWCYTGPRVCGLAFFDWLAFDLSAEANPAHNERCIAHRWSDERVVFCSERPHEVGDALQLSLRLGAAQTLLTGARIDARSEAPNAHGTYEYEAALDPLPAAERAQLIDAAFGRAVQRQAVGAAPQPLLLGGDTPQRAVALGHTGAHLQVISPAPLGGQVTVQLRDSAPVSARVLHSAQTPDGCTHTLLALKRQPSALADLLSRITTPRLRRLDVARFAPLTAGALALSLVAGATMTPPGLRPAWIRHGLRLGTQLGAAAEPPAAATYATRGTAMIGPDGQPLPTIRGISWFGFETDTYVPHGLWTRPMDDVLDQVKMLGFNTIRVPFSTASLHRKVANSVSFVHNPDLVGLTPLEVMDELIARAARRGLYIILDRHSLDERDHRLDDLWYSDAYPESMLIDDWQMLARRYRGIPQILGADIHNEPKGMATWGSGHLPTDWRLAAERIGNAVLEANPDWLIFVEGVSAPYGCGPFGVDDVSECYWDGGNLSAVRAHPVRLSIANKVVYSPHIYGPGLFQQPWHNDLWFPDNLPAIWDKKFAFIHDEGIAPVLVGEFGGPGYDDSTLDGQWKQAFVAYLKKKNLSWSYWTLNPESADTKGILQDDWVTVHEGRYQALDPLMTGAPHQDIAPPAGALCMTGP